MNKLQPFNDPCAKNAAFQSSSNEIMSIDPLFLWEWHSMHNMNNNNNNDNNDALCADFSRMSIGNLHDNNEGLQCVTTLGHVNMNVSASAFNGFVDSVGSAGPSTRYLSDQVDCFQQRRGLFDLRNDVPSPYLGNGFGVSGSGMEMGFGGGGGIGVDRGRMMRSRVSMDMGGSGSGLSRRPYYGLDDRAGFSQGNAGVGVFGFGSNLVMQERGLNHLTGGRFFPVKGRGELRKNVAERGVVDVDGHAENWDLNGKGEGVSKWSGLPSGSSLSDMKDHIYLMAKDQSGCRFLQKMLDEGTAVDDIFDVIVIHIVELTLNPFGNYLVQKLLGMSTEEQKMRILLKMTELPGQLVSLSLSSHGTRVVQSLIQSVRGRSQISLLRSALEPGFLDLVMDLNGNHVLQTCLKYLSNEDNLFIFRAAMRFCVPIATHQHGCCVLQRCIEHATGEYQVNLVNEISANGLHLAQDPFGNYVVQFIIRLEIPSAAAILNSQFEGQYVNLSMQKFSSHVVEKCLTHFEDFRSSIVQELLSVPQFDKLMQDPFANYVIRVALSVTKGRLHASLVHAVQPHKILRTSPYCKRIFSSLNSKK